MGNSATHAGDLAGVGTREDGRERGNLTLLERRWKHMYGPATQVVGGKPTGARNRMFDRRMRTGWDADGAWRVSETEREIFDLRRNATRVDRCICARSMGITEGKFMVQFEEAMRRARFRDSTG